MADQIIIRNAGSLTVTLRKPDTVVRVTSSGVVVRVATSGPQGPPGPRGPAGSGTSEVFTQVSPAASWIVTHNLGRAPIIDVYVDGELVQADVITSDANTATVVFALPQAGEAIYS